MQVLIKSLAGALAEFVQGLIQMIMSSPVSTSREKT